MNQRNLETMLCKKQKWGLNMESILKQGDIVTFENNQKYLISKTIECDNKLYHYMIKLKDNQEQPEVIFTKEIMLTNGELDLKAIVDTELLESLVNKLKEII